MSHRLKDIAWSGRAAGVLDEVCGQLHNGKVAGPRLVSSLPRQGLSRTAIRALKERGVGCSPPALDEAHYMQRWTVAVLVRSCAGSTTPRGKLVRWRDGRRPLDNGDTQGPLHYVNRNPAIDEARRGEAGFHNPGPARDVETPAPVVRTQPHATGSAGVEDAVPGWTEVPYAAGRGASRPARVRARAYVSG